MKLFQGLSQDSLEALCMASGELVAPPSAVEPESGLVYCENGDVIDPLVDGLKGRLRAQAYKPRPKEDKRPVGIRVGKRKNTKARGSQAASASTLARMNHHSGWKR